MIWAIIDHSDDEIFCDGFECHNRASIIVKMRSGRWTPYCLVHAAMGRAFNKRVHKAKANAKYDGVT